MAGSGFQVQNDVAAGSDVIEAVLSLASTQYHVGDAITVKPGSGDKGIANLVAATDIATHIVVSMVTPDSVIAPATPLLTTALQETLLCTPILGGRVRLKSYLTGDAVPPINKVACNANSTATQALVTAAGSTNDYLDGQIYIPELDQQRLITADSVSAGVHTFTVSPAFSQAPTTGNTAIVVPWSKGQPAVKFNATTPYQCISTAVADKTGGQNRIESVNLKGDTFGPYVITSMPATS